MRFKFGSSKSRIVEKKHGVSLEEAQEIFNQVYLIDQRNDDPEQFRAIGWSGGRLCSVILEIRRDADGEYYHLITALESDSRKSKSMPKTSLRERLSADDLAEKASRGEDISAYFTDKFTVIRPVRRVNIDLTQGMLRELDQRAARLNLNRQAVIKTLLDRALGEDRPRKARVKKRAGLSGGFSSRREIGSQAPMPLKQKLTAARPARLLR